MTNILEIYRKYKIMPVLQQHQLRVAAVAKQICDSLTVETSAESVVKACLLHDLGNIIKFDLSQFPEFLEPKGRDYWEKVKTDFEEKYGQDEHRATLKIVTEIGVSQDIIDCIDSIVFKKISRNYFEGTIAQKICNYSDMRVGPRGVISIDDRLADGARRYQSRKNYVLQSKERSKIAADLHDVEDQLFEKSKIKPSDISDKSISPIIEQLKAYEI